MARRLTWNTRINRKPSPKAGVKEIGKSPGNTDWNIIININRVNRNKVIILLTVRRTKYEEINDDIGDDDDGCGKRNG